VHREQLAPALELADRVWFLNSPDMGWDLPKAVAPLGARAGFAAGVDALVKDLADDLEAELNGHYPPEVRAYPSEQRRYERDMANVYEARRALEPKP